MSWTHDRIEQLKKLWEAGYTASSIATELGGITRNAVIGKAHRLGLSGRMKSKSKISSVSIVRKRKIPNNTNSKVIELTTTATEPMNPVSFANIKEFFNPSSISPSLKSDFISPYLSVKEAVRVG